MGTSQSRPTEHLKRYSRVASDQLKSMLRRPGRTGDDDDEKPSSTDVEPQATNSDDSKTPNSETAAVRMIYIVSLWLCPYIPLSATTTYPNASYCSLPSDIRIIALISSKLIISKYRTGKTLGSGTYAIVKEAIHVETGKYFACKVINKKLMEGREHMVSLFLFSLSIVIHLYPTCYFY